MPEFLRVRDEFGNEYSVVASAFDKKTATEVSGPAVDDNGDPLPPQLSAPSGSGKPGLSAESERKSH